MTDYETIEVAIADGAATITLNRPDKLNAWNLQLGIDLRHAVEGLAADESVRAVMITGAAIGVVTSRGRVMRLSVLDLSNADWRSSSRGRGDVQIAFVEGFIVKEYWSKPSSWRSRRSIRTTAPVRTAPPRTAPPVPNRARTAPAHQGVPDRRFPCSAS